MVPEHIDWKRLFIALIIGTLLSALFLGALHSWSGYPVGRIYSDLDDFPVLVLIYFQFAFITAVIIAVPVLIILSRINCLSGPVFLTVGTILGAGWSIPLFGPQPPPYVEVIFFACGGFLASALFWLVYTGAYKQMRRM